MYRVHDRKVKYSLHNTIPSHDTWSGSSSTRSVLPYFYDSTHVIISDSVDGSASDTTWLHRSQNDNLCSRSTTRYSLTDIGPGWYSMATTGPGHFVPDDLTTVSISGGHYNFGPESLGPNESYGRSYEVRATSPATQLGSFRSTPSTTGTYKSDGPVPTPSLLGYAGRSS